MLSTLGLAGIRDGAGIERVGHGRTGQPVRARFTLLDPGSGFRAGTVRTGRQSKRGAGEKAACNQVHGIPSASPRSAWNWNSCRSHCVEQTRIMFQLLHPRLECRSRDRLRLHSCCRRPSPTRPSTARSGSESRQPFHAISSDRIGIDGSTRARPTRRRRFSNWLDFGEIALVNMDDHFRFGDGFRRGSPARGRQGLPRTQAVSTIAVAAREDQLQVMSISNAPSAGNQVPLPI